MITLFTVNSYIWNWFVDIYPTKYFIHARGDNLLRRFLFAKVSAVRVNAL